MSEIINYNTDIIESDPSKFIVNFLLPTSFAITFMAFLFFTYTKNTDLSIVIDKYNLNNFLQMIPIPKEPLSPEQIDFINLEGDKVIKVNLDLIHEFIKLYGAILIISFVLAYIISEYYNVNFQDILIYNIFLLLLLSTTEYFFFNNKIYIK